MLTDSDNVVTKNLYAKIAKLPFLLLNLLKALNQVREFQKFSNEFREVTARGNLHLDGESNDLVLDTGAAVHCIPDRAMFSTYKRFTITKAAKVKVANGTSFDAHGYGNVVLKMTSSGLNLKLKNVLHVPNIRKSLVSGSELCKDFIKLEFESGKALLSRNGKFIGDGYLNYKGLFVLDATIVYP